MPTPPALVIKVHGAGGATGAVRTVTEPGFSASEPTKLVGQNWNLGGDRAGGNGEEGWITPDGSTLMIRPAQLRSSMYPYPVSTMPRMRLVADFGYDPGSPPTVPWEETCPRSIATDYFCTAQGIGAVLEQTEAQTPWPDNCGMWLATQCVGPRGGNYWVVDWNFAKRSYWDGSAYQTGADLKLAVRSNGWTVLSECAVLTANAAANATSLSIGPSAEWAAGMTVQVGDNTYQVTAFARGSLTASTVTITPGLRAAADSGDHVAIPLMQAWLSGSRDDFAGRMLEIMVLPFRRNSILIWGGGGFLVYEDKALPTDQTDSTITKARLQKLQFTQTKGIFQLLPLYYPYLSGAEIAMTSAAMKLPYAPTAAPTHGRFEVDVPSGCILMAAMCASDRTNVTWDGGTSEAYYRVWASNTQIGTTGLATFSPMLYNLSWDFGVVQQAAWDMNPDDIADEVLAESLSIRLSEDPSQRTCQFDLVKGYTVSNPEKWQNRLVTITWGADEIFKGWLVNPRQALALDDSMEFEAQDGWKRFSQTYLQSCVAYDGMYAVEAIRDLVKRGGLLTEMDFAETYSTADIEIDSFDTTLLGKAARDEDDLYRPKVGTSVGEFIRDLVGRHFARDWDVGFKPTGTAGSRLVKFVCKPLSETSKATFYRTTAAAPLGYADLRMLEHADIENCEPEANEVWVVGMAADGSPIIDAQGDSLSQSGDLGQAVTEGLSEELWLGFRKLLIVIDASLNTQADVNTASDLYWANCFRVYRKASFKADYSPMLGPGDAITLDGMGLWRILSMDVRILFANTNGMLAECRYEVEDIP